MTHARDLTIVILMLGLSACATTAGTDRATSRGQDAMTRPLRDLSLVQRAIPPELAAAAAAPYGVEHAKDCTALLAEIEELDHLLGADIDEVRAKGPGFAEDAAIGALQSLFDLPFRGVIRRVSGAERLDRDTARAVLAGMVRRGYLKGLARAAGCPAPAAPVAADPGA
jgi:hypothetical protein